MPTIERTAFEHNRSLEFFSEKEIQMQIGHARPFWPVALIKELVDNALDACETANVDPRIAVTIAADSVTVEDNGPGLPASTLERSIDYLIRVSDKACYVSPSRGQLGNALKCIWAAPFVVNGEHGRVTVATAAGTREIDVSLDRIAGEPQITLTLGAPIVKNGTRIEMHWPGIAGYPATPIWPLSTNPLRTGSLFHRVCALLERYAAINAHGTFAAHLTGPAPEHREWIASGPCSKWTPSQPTSPHWYTTELLRNLVAGYLGTERKGEPTKTIRAFVAEFAGLLSSAKQRAVTIDAGIHGPLTAMLLPDGLDVDPDQIESLLTAMQKHSRPVKPEALGEIGEAHTRRYMAEYRGADEGTITYARRRGTADGLPYVLEVAFAKAMDNTARRRVEAGLNFSPAIADPLSTLPGLLNAARVDNHDPVLMVIHITCPRLSYKDHGKTLIDLPSEMEDSLQSAVTATTKTWTQLKRKVDRDGRLRASALRSYRCRPVNSNIKEAAYQIMAEAYAKASGNGELPANARQIMYAARPLVLALTGDKCWKSSSYFTQHLLPDYLTENPESTATWDVVYDARGHFAEPHTGHRIDLGTLGVRRYIKGWSDLPTELEVSTTLETAYPTNGPALRFQYALFVEKEGFNELWQAAKLAEEFDLAIMSTKGMSVTAARSLVESLTVAGVKTFVIRDFDKSGFSIVHTLRTDTRRYLFDAAPDVIDLGLRLADVEEMGLESEPVEYDGKIDPRENLRESGATEEECSFLVKRSGYYPPPWKGQRVELNAMDSPQIVAWVKKKLIGHGVRKFVPPLETLAAAYHRACRIALLQHKLQEIDNELPDTNELTTPPWLADRIRMELDRSPTASWDAIVATLAKEA